MSYIELKNVNVGFGSGTARTEVLSDLNLSVEKGEFIAIVGYSGTGKSTLMNLLAGLLKPDSGEVIVNGLPVAGPSAERGLVFQNYSLLPWFSVEHNVALSVNEIYRNESGQERRERIRKAIERVNLSPATHKKPGELSGGMRQRTSVARTLATNPEVLLLDEPLSALDALTRSVIQDQILDIWQKENQTILLITNDVDEGLYMADRIIPLSIGPGASFGPEVKVDMPRPRDRRAIQAEPAFQRLRGEIIRFLLAEKEKERARGSKREISLPNIRPMNISKHKPSWFLGLRPRKKKVLA